MFEFEVDHKILPASELDEETKLLFVDSQAKTTAISLLPWEEHCTECAVPACYQTCELYQARKDGKCRRFVEGISFVPDAPNPQDGIAKVSFKRWGELMAYGNVHLYSPRRAHQLERFSQKIERLVSKLPDSGISLAGRRGISSRIWRRVKQYILSSGLLADRKNTEPSHLLLEAYNPSSEMTKLSLVVRNPESQVPFQQLLELPMGFTRTKIPYPDIATRVDTSREFHVLLNPNILQPEEEGKTLYFGNLAFVSENEASSSAKKEKPVKVLAWDLDNTLWQGILVEDGAEKLELKPEIAQIVKELDRRGIINSIVSKNNEAEALEVLERFSLREYFVFPKISWQPKSQAIKELIEDFNVGADAIAFIDDSEFEREEVRVSNPSVRILPESDYQSLLERAEFNPPQSSESSRRREFYLNQKKRSEAYSGFQGEYFDFLRDCQIQLSINTAAESSLERIHELVQRTNQLNFSGNRYSREELDSLLADTSYDLYTLSCNDRFGDYGMVGFAIVKKDTTLLQDMMFSCRIQSKRVEHAFLSFLLQHYQNQGIDRFAARYKKTDRNAPAGKVFEDLNFQETNREDNTYTYEFSLTNEISREDFISINWQNKPWIA